MKKIIFTRPDGGLSVVTPVRCTGDEDLSDEEVEQRAWDKLPTDAINPQWVEASAIPADRSFRNAWKDGGGKVDHDMAKCREITRNALREKRAPLMAALDVKYMRADEAGNVAEKARITTEKQRLRDITKNPAIEAATTPEALVALDAL